MVAGVADYDSLSGAPLPPPLPPEAIALFNRGCKALASASYGEASAYFRAASLTCPDWARPHYNLACALREMGDVAGAINALRRGHAVDPEDPAIAYNLATLLIDTGHFEEGAALLDELVERHPDEQKYLDNRAHASWRAYAAAGARDVGSGFVRILLACMPKSGSTYLADLLASLPSMHRAHLVPNYGRREQVLGIVQLVQYRRINYVSQLHLKPSETTRELMTSFGLRPVVLIRNLWDVMVSLRDHMHHHSLDWSMAQVDPEFCSWDQDRQYDFLARAMMPWFIDFHVSWSRIADKLALNYESLIADPSAVVMRIVEWSGLSVSPEDVAAAVAGVGHARTFNQGGSGRGRAVPESARTHVRALASYYPDVDFVPLLG